MKKLILIIALFSAITSCKKENTQPLTKLPIEIDTTKIDTIKNNVLVDIDGNVYKTVIIGSQTWMGENLKVSKYNDGTPIPNISDNFEWYGADKGAYCYYNNDSKYNDIYGKLYNWYVVNTNKVCPSGWRVSTNEDWIILQNYLGGDSIAAGKLKEFSGLWYDSTRIKPSNINFNVRPGGYRELFDMSMGHAAYFWTSTPHEYVDTIPVIAKNIGVANGGDNVMNSYARLNQGLSIRCVKK